MSDDFDLDKSRWYNTMKIGLACKNAKQDAETIIERSRVLANFEYEPTVGAELSHAETALSEALLALSAARQEYEQNTKTVLVAAE